MESDIKIVDRQSDNMGHHFIKEDGIRQINLKVIGTVKTRRLPGEKIESMGRRFRMET